MALSVSILRRVSATGCAAARKPSKEFGFLLSSNIRATFFDSEPLDDDSSHGERTIVSSVVMQLLNGALGDRRQYAMLSHAGAPAISLHLATTP